jgi:hypothetical protein
MTNRIDRLEQAALVASIPTRRTGGACGPLTAAGCARVDSALADLLTSERMLLHPISARSRQTLADLLRALLAPLDAE